MSALEDTDAVFKAGQRDPSDRGAELPRPRLRQYPLLTKPDAGLYSPTPAGAHTDLDPPTPATGRGRVPCGVLQYCRATSLWLVVVR